LSTDATEIEAANAILQHTNTGDEVMSTIFFGQATAKRLHHPPLPVIVKELVAWCWDHGDKQGNSRITKSHCLRLIPLLGTVLGVKTFPGEVYWEKHCQITGGLPSVTCVIESWRIEQYYGQLSSQRKAIAEASASRVDLSETDLRAEMLYFLKGQELVKHDALVITEILIAFGVGTRIVCDTILQKHLKDIPGCNWNQATKRSIVAAVSQVGTNKMKKSMLTVGGTNLLRPNAHQAKLSFLPNHEDDVEVETDGTLENLDIDELFRCLDDEHDDLEADSTPQHADDNLDDYFAFYDML
jgi:hypothetical protein